MILTPTQKIIASDLHRFRVCCTGRRWGKTTLAVLEMIGKACSKPDLIVAYVATTFGQARDLAWVPLRKLAEPVIVKVDETRLELTVKTKGAGVSRIILRGWESIETLRGMRVDFIVIDEIASMRNWDVNWQEVIRPTLTDSRGDAMFISTPKGFNHFHEIYNLEAQDSDYKSFHFTSFDNPILPVEELEKARMELTEDRFAQEYLADFRKTEGLVYKEFDRTKHLTTDKPNRVVRRIAGLDFGYTNPACILVCEIDDDRNYWIRSEWYKTGRTNEEILEYAKTLNVDMWYPDPAEPDRIEAMRRMNMQVREVNKDVSKGIDSVRALFKNGKIRIDRSCLNLISELETYSYKEKRADQNEPEEPIKENDHALDCLRYMLFMSEPMPHPPVVRKQFVFQGDVTTY